MDKKLVYIFHAGNMNNRGTQALISSDVSSINKIFNNNVDIIISTSDISGVEKLKLNIKEITATLIDIPFEKSDELIRKRGELKRGIKYTLFSLFYFIRMFLELFLVFISTIFMKIGLKPFYKSKILNYIKKSNIIISCSDENYKEGSSLYSMNFFWLLTWWSLLFSRTVDVAISTMLKKRVVIFPNSVGPFQTSIGKILAKLSFSRFSFTLLREAISYDIVKKMNINTNMILTGDAALLYEVNNEKKVIKKIGNPIMGISPGFYSGILSKREIENYIQVHAKLIDYAIEKYYMYIHLLPHYVSGFENDDLDICKKIYAQCNKKDYIKLIVSENLKIFKNELNGLDLHISSKMHPTILATSNFIPAISIAYDHKQIGFYQNFGLEGMAINLKGLTYEDLKNELDFVWQNRAKIKQQLEEKVPAIQGSILNSMKHAVEKSLQ
jgi:colanic acid/amylovoran biosynthesis protein